MGGSNQRYQSQSGEESVSDLVIDYTSNPWCVACGSFDADYQYNESTYMLFLTCSRCGFKWDMKPKWTIPADQVVF